MSVSSFGSGLIDHLGVVGVAIGVALNGLAVPWTSEVVLPLAGVAVKEGHQSLVAVLVAAFVGQMVGSIGAYYIGRYAGEPVIEKYGKYVLVRKRELDRAQAAFSRHGAPLVIVGSFMPGIQGLVGYVAGLAELSLARFVVYLVIGKIIWIGGLVGLGYALGRDIDMLGTYLHQFGLVAFVAVLGGVFWYIRRQRLARRAGTSGDHLNEQ